MGMEDQRVMPRMPFSDHTWVADRLACSFGVHIEVFWLGFDMGEAAYTVMKFRENLANMSTFSEHDIVTLYDSKRRR